MSDDEFDFAVGDYVIHRDLAVTCGRANPYGIVIKIQNKPPSANWEDTEGPFLLYQQKGGRAHDQKLWVLARCWRKTDGPQPRPPPWRR